MYVCIYVCMYICMYVYTIFICHCLQINSFQCVMATNGYDSFIMFLYAHDELQWTKDNAVAGYFTDNGRFFTTPASRRRKIITYITQNSNVDIPGTWIFHVNGGMHVRVQYKLNNECIYLCDY